MKVNEKAHVRQDMGGKAWREDSWRNSPSTSSEYHDRPRKGSGVPVYLDDRMCGARYGTTFLRVVDIDKQLYHPLNGFAYRTDLLYSLVRQGVAALAVRDKYGRGEWQVSLAEFMKKSETINPPRQGIQRCLPLKFWRRPGEVDRQISLFGGDGD